MQDFKSAYLRLQEIATLFKSGEIIDIDEMVKLQEEAKALTEYLEGKLKG